jgi:hypothetical protein
VAAQSSRDRKKARLDDLEAEVKALKDKVCGMYVCYCCFLCYFVVNPLERLESLIQIAKGFINCSVACQFM